ncbi:MULTISPECIES: chemotaxis protein CheB [unclassified Moraxella]|uniref:chemotaxis protein CheB n=1 Tax=unclassified Moraxella TaxID=2685852 RepID=UPI003AF92F46
MYEVAGQTNPPLKFIVVAESNQQRLAFSDTIREWGFDLIDCLSTEQLTAKHFQQPVDVWLVDTEADYEVLQTIEQTVQATYKYVVLVGFVPAPYINESQPYAKWQRQLKRKLAQTLLRPDLLPKDEENICGIEPWRYVVLLGASMGGPLAVKEFLDELPASLPITILLAQHFNQNMLNTLPRVLNRHNDWRCEVVTTTQQLLSGRCHIIPIEQSIVCDSNGRVIIQKVPWQGIYKPNISQVIHNCSDAFGNNLINIIFSGMGNDGQDAVPYAKHNGSSIWVQNPIGSTCTSQPQSAIDTGEVDYVATPKEMAQALITLCKTKRMPKDNALDGCC